MPGEGMDGNILGKNIYDAVRAISGIYTQGNITQASAEEIATRV